MLVGLTGGIATGKSTVSQIFTELGCPVIDADKIARQVVEPGKPAWKKIVENFGSEVLLEDKQVNRARLGEIIFTDNAKRRKLNSCTHPYIQKEMLWQILHYLFRGHKIVILDIPLLYEGSQLLNLISQVIVVYCDDQSQLRRLVARNSLTKEEAQQRIQSQMSLEEKCRRANIVIDNSGSLEATREKVLLVYQQLSLSYRPLINRALFFACLLALAAGAWSLSHFIYSKTLQW